MRLAKGWVVVAALVSVAFFSGAALAEGPKVGVIDVNKILNESEAGKAAKKKMEARFEELKKQIETKQDEARKMKEDLDKQKVLLGKEKLKEKEDALAAKVNELRQMTQESEREMQTRQGELTREILALIEVQVKKVVDSEKIDLLLDKMQGGVVHFNSSMEYTAKVLDLLNKEEKGAAAGTDVGKNKKEKPGGK